MLIQVIQFCVWCCYRECILVWHFILQGPDISRLFFELISLCVCVCSGRCHACRSQKTTLGDVPWVLPTFLTKGSQSRLGCYPVSARIPQSPSPCLGLHMCTTLAASGARTRVLILVQRALSEQSCLLSSVSCCWGFLFWVLGLAVETGFSAPSDLELIILLPQPSECWDYMCVPSYLGCRLILSILGDVYQRQ